MTQTFRFNSLGDCDLGKMFIVFDVYVCRCVCVDVRNELFARFALCTLQNRYNQIHKVQVKQMEKTL